MWARAGPVLPPKVQPWPNWSIELRVLRPSTFTASTAMPAIRTLDGLLRMLQRCCRRRLQVSLLRLPYCSPSRQLAVSIGATPTAHVLQHLEANAPPNVQIELHAGQCTLSSLPPRSRQRGADPGPCRRKLPVQRPPAGFHKGHNRSGPGRARVATEACSVYPERNEALLNAGQRWGRRPVARNQRLPRVRPCRGQS
jgi:hypothetical protein